MSQTLGDGTDNHWRGTSRLRQLPLVPDSPTPSRSLIAVVATLVVILMLGAMVVIWRHSTDRFGLDDYGVGLQAPPECWNGPPAGDQCKPLLGEGSLRWVFPADPTFSSCEKTDSLGRGEIRTVRCEWEDLNPPGALASESTYVFLSSWDSTASMSAYYDNIFGASQPSQVLDGTGIGEDGALRWTSLTPPGAGPATAVGYANYPFSFLVMGPQQNRDAAVERMRMRSIEEIREQL